ncbi:sodium:proton antiporter [Mariprofundus erugo]|uniref:Sodium:proton antiporter n=1 Tax=Mariprofundus erugo TaxID=2528639 RepID=A0A5R9GIC5_9PROT|nr:cation:proton antiporter [Mariprofundus erugo]TLS66486.1 sodium:proton antiporter [Mariprofundus erugo]TLS77869.1 sodium:proton antiporter [Mariprofundus erugo]
MITTLLVISIILYVALQLEDKLSIPSPLGLIGLSFLTHYLFQQTPLLTGDMEHFAELVVFLLPVLLIADSLELKLADLKEHALSLFYLAVVAVALSVVLAIFTADWFFGQYHLSVAAIIVLFAMVLATDPVSVVSIFAKFDLPHKLKILAEGESLFNDATALIVFVFVGLYALDGGDITATYVTETSLMVVFGSALFGFVIGLIGLAALKTTENRIAEMMLLITTGYGAFELSEHFYTLLNLFGAHSHMHLSGILSCIFATITIHHLMTRSIEADEARLDRNQERIQQEAQSVDSSRNVIAYALGRIRISMEERDRHLRTKEDVKLLALVANTILFVAMAEIINLSMLWQYKTEIIAMFVATTIIRALMMAKFAIITNQTTHMTNVNFRWWGVLTFAGIKGGLSVVMLMMIPASFEHLEMFKAVVVGVIMLSTFIYSGILLVLIAVNKESFAREVAEEGAHH